MSEAITAESRPRGRARYFGYGLLVLILLVAVYYVGGMIYLHKIDDDTSFGSNIEVPAGASYSVAVTEALVDREVNQHRWVANDPWFQPGYLLDNMPNFQVGIVAALSRFTVELTDHLARSRGTSQVDPDADGAAGRLKYPGDVWIFEWSSTPVQPSSESQYRKAAEDLRRFNERLAAGQATFERRGDNLIATLTRIASDTGGSSASSFQKIEQTSNSWLDFSADDLFYQNKGRMYAYAVLLPALGKDFQQIITERNIQKNWDDMVSTFRAAAVLQPWVVMNGALDSAIKPNHLAAQGFLLLRARFQLYEIIDILNK